jgi:hypothetical protein
VRATAHMSVRQRKKHGWCKCPHMLPYVQHQLALAPESHVQCTHLYWSACLNCSATFPFLSYVCNLLCIHLPSRSVHIKRSAHWSTSAYNPQYLKQRAQPCVAAYLAQVAALWSTARTAHLATTAARALGRTSASTGCVWGLLLAAHNPPSETNCNAHSGELSVSVARQACGLD